ncbi:junctional adhesion molecule A-like isoform X1 [Xyrichtys novacula]|uniref:Junctional adhesion molecule A-like isoform X1 n=2 Tax=Xyrichtys novacula TaxID=13765 RepID=A0AAV1HNQ9_XYRNO|nr:junctional adhesion molecule A-like isoform X1 [Xyrichtys novacula]
MRILDNLWGFIVISVCLVWAHASDVKYGIKGQDVTLRPSPVPSPITNIQWNHGEDIAAEWSVQLETDCYRQFKGRCSLDQSTGALKITGLTGSDGGIYTVEINHQLINPRIELSVISEVPKPSISENCDAEMTNCELTCEGNTTGAGPVTYKWILDDTDGPSDKVLTVNKETPENSFYCLMSNPVSNHSSGRISNPFIAENHRVRLTSIIIPVIILGILVLGIVGFVIFCRRRRGQTTLNGGNPRGAKATPAETMRMIRYGSNGCDAAHQQPNHVSSGSEVRGEPDQGSASAGSTNHLSGEGELTEVQINAETHNPSRDSAGASATPEQNPADTAPADITMETAEIQSAVDETSDQDQSAPGSVSTSKETGDPEDISDVQETAVREPTAGGPEDAD